MWVLNDVDEEVCRQAATELRRLGPGHVVASPR